MSRTGPEPAAGERWAYRERANDDLAEVEVVRLGIKAPARVLVRWIDDAFEGKQDWVPPARLKARWDDVSTFRAREQRWASLLAESNQYSEAVGDAVSSVFDLLVDDQVAKLGYNATAGVLRVRDVSALATLAGVEAATLRSPTSFEEDGELVSGMPISVAVARDLAGRQPHVVLEYVEREEADARREAIYGRVYPARGRGKGWEVSPEICREIDEEHGRPVRRVLRAWAGADAADLRADIAAARAETRRVAELAAAALEALRASGHVRTATRLEKESGGLPALAKDDQRHPIVASADSITSQPPDTDRVAPRS